MHGKSAIYRPAMQSISIPPTIGHFAEFIYLTPDDEPTLLPPRHYESFHAVAAALRNGTVTEDHMAVPPKSKPSFIMPAPVPVAADLSREGEHHPRNVYAGDLNCVSWAMYKPDGQNPYDPLNPRGLFACYTDEPGIRFPVMGSTGIANRTAAVEGGAEDVNFFNGGIHGSVHIFRNHMGQILNYNQEAIDHNERLYLDFPTERELAFLKDGASSMGDDYYSTPLSLWQTRVLGGTGIVPWVLVTLPQFIRRHDRYSSYAARPADFCKAMSVLYYGQSIANKSSRCIEPFEPVYAFMSQR